LLLAMAGGAAASSALAQAGADAGVVSGGGRGPHQTLPMQEQLPIVESMLGARPSLQPPAGVAPSYWAALIPKDNALTEARVALGRKLYFDERLSADGTVACATCHDVSRGFSDRRSTSEGIGDNIGKRNAPTSMNSVFFSTLFLDGRAESLEEQAKLPIVNPIEMGHPDGASAMASIAGDAEYQKAFQEAYGRDPNFEDLARAIGSFERTLVFLSAPFDRFARGEVGAISDDAKAGWALFHGKARCTACHQMSASNPIGTDNRFHNIGVAARHRDFEKLADEALQALSRGADKESIDRLALQTDLSELGRFVVTRNRADIGAFKTSQLRNVGVTAPYMHDGSLPTLWDVMDHYNKGGEPNAFLDGGMEPLALTEQELNQMVAFLFSLTDDRFGHQNATELQRQRAIAATQRPLRDDDAANRRVLLFEQRAAAGR
jgi:cytochrome c peroxidase